MIKVIVCGFGFMGQNHAANIMNSSDMKLAAVVDVTDKSKVRKIEGNVATSQIDLEKLEDVPFFPTLEEALAKCDADAVLIATPTRSHVPLALTAIAANKHVFIEKPLCVSNEEAEQLKSAVKGKDLAVQVGHCVRFSQPHRLLRRAIQEKTYGKLRYLKLYRMTGTPNWGAWKELDVSLSSVSGPLFDLNIHDIDLVLSFLGEPDKITAQKLFGSENAFQSFWSYDDGCTVQVEGGFILPSTVPFRAGFLATFENAVLEHDASRRNILIVSDQNSSTEIDCSSSGNVYELELQEFVSAINNKTPIQCGVDEAAKAIMISHKLRELF